MAELCVTHKIDYVTIDAQWNSQMAQQARPLVCSHEFLNREYPDENMDDLLVQYRSVCRGLVIFTLGAREILYASQETAPDRFQPYEIEVIDTLTAGDTFRAGVVFGILESMYDRDVVRFATAYAGVACTRFPSVHEPPTLGEIESLMNAS